MPPARASIELRRAPAPAGGSASAGHTVDGPPVVRSNFEPKAYEAIVERAKEYIRAGDVIQVVLAQRFQCALPRPSVQHLPLPAHLQPVAVHVLPARRRAHRARRVARGDGAARGRRAHRAPDRRHAAARAPTSSEDASSSVELRRRPEGDRRAHHAGRPGPQRRRPRVATSAAVAVTERHGGRALLARDAPGLERARRRWPRLDCFDAFRATFPAGTLSGAPKIRAMEIIEELEPVRRGVYGGAVGYFGFSGNMDTAIAIRTMVIDGGTIYAAGGRGHRRRLRSRARARRSASTRRARCSRRSSWRRRCSHAAHDR